jgi:hypothetical protein
MRRQPENTDECGGIHAKQREVKVPSAKQAITRLAMNTCLAIFLNQKADTLICPLSWNA